MRPIRPAGTPWRTPLPCLRAASLAAFALASGGAAAADVTLAPDTLDVVRGSASEQGVAALAERSQSGTSDGWADYVEFSTGAYGFVADFGFELPLDLVDAPLDALSVETNYKGSTRRFQTWQWSIRDARTGRWQTLGDNRGAPDWRWHAQRFEVPGDAADHVDELGRVKLRLRSPRAGDDANLDLLALRVDTSRPAPQRLPAAPATAPAATTDPGTTPEPRAEPSPASATSDDGIWRPAPGTSWQIQFTGAIDTSLDVDMYDLDLYDTPKSRIDALHADARVVICYFSAGTWENWRPDAGRFPARTLGANNADWPGEKWLDIRALDALAPIMDARLDLAVEKGCDGVEPDNVDGYANATGLPLTFADQLAYNRYLAEAAHARGLSIGLKNDLGQIRELEPYFDWALNESCNVYDECELLSPFVAAGKAVFGIEYRGDPATFCSRTNALDFDFLKKPRLLGAAREACR